MRAWVWYDGAEMYVTTAIFHPQGKGCSCRELKAVRCFTCQSMVKHVTWRNTTASTMQHTDTVARSATTTGGLWK